jgi:hypothetical protein
MNTSSFVKDIGRSFFVSSFLPAALFVSAGIIAFRDFVPSYLVNRLNENNSIFGSDWFISIILIAWTSFFLYSVLPWTRENLDHLFDIKQTLQQASNNLLSQELYDDYADCWIEARGEYVNLELVCPIDEKQMLPTRLGNLLRSCSNYPNYRYGLDGDIIWPRLLKVLPIKFQEDKDDDEAKLIFMLNSSLLSFFFGVISLLASLIGLFLKSFLKYELYGLYENFAPGYFHVSPSGYLIIGFLFIMLGYFTYRLAVEAGENFAISVRNSYDLYRFKLLKQLNLSIPQNLEQERKIWPKVSEFLATGDMLGLKPLKIDFSFDDENRNLTVRKRKTTKQNPNL